MPHGAPPTELYRVTGSGTTNGPSLHQLAAIDPDHENPPQIRNSGGHLPWAERVLWMLVGILLIEWSIRIYGSVTTFPIVIIAVVVLGAAGLATIGFSWLPTVGSSRYYTLWTWAVLVLVLGAFVVWGVIQIHSAPGYATDEIAFDQYAATLANHGLNPYVHSMAPSFSLYRVAPDAFTYTLSGHPVLNLSYPALAFELYMPFLKLGWSTQLAVVLNMAAWTASIVLLFVLLPKRLRPAALVIGSLTTYISYTVGGVTDILYVPLLIGAAYLVPRFSTQRGLCRLIGPVLLGLAMAIKQTPWFVLPFVAGAIWLESRATNAKHPARDALVYTGCAIATFAVPNAYFFGKDPSAWLRGVLTPFGHAVPAGQGVIGLSLFTRLGGGSLSNYTIFTAVLMVALVCAYLATYPAMRSLTFLLPAVVLFFAYRSFGSYLVALIPAAFIAAVAANQQPRPVGPRPLRGSGLVAIAAGGLTLISFGVALAARQPLTVRIVGVRTTGQLATVDQLRLEVTNRTASPLHPAFTVNEGGQITTFWSVVEGPSDLGANQSAFYTLQSANFSSQPGIGGGFQVMAFTTEPATVSTSAAYLPTSLHIGLTPDALNTPIPLGQPVVVRADLYDQIDRRVRRSGVPIYLGQVIYAQQGLVLSEASVNGRSPGQTPVVAYTDSRGQATFTIVGTQVTSNPVYFEANLVDASQFYPYGYSEIVPIRFVRP
jgi:hypothetical protein